MDADAQQPRLAELLRPVRLVALDVDGTLTDGAVIVAPQGEVLRFHVLDGLAIKLLQQQHIVVAWISGRGPEVAERRARELGVSEIHLKAQKKDEVLRSIQTRLRISARETAAVGDDLPDLPMRAHCAFFAAPADARAEVVARADFVTRAAGGAGAVREVVELLLRAQGRWSAIVDAYGG